MADITVKLPNLANQTAIVNALNKISQQTLDVRSLVSDSVKENWKTIYPVGSIYLSVSSASPASLFGGSWEQIKDRFLLAAGSTYGAGTTGGEASHTLTEAELPNIKGSIWNMAYQDTSISMLGAEGVFELLKRNEGHGSGTYTKNNGYDGITMSFGSNQPHNNMPPYLAVYMWKRVA